MSMILLNIIDKVLQVDNTLLMKKVNRINSVDFKKKMKLCLSYITWIA